MSTKMIYLISFVLVLGLAASLASAQSVKINFQILGGETPEGYLPDGGEVFGDRGNGFSYGWNVDSTGGARKSNVHPDERYDTFIHLDKGQVPSVDGIWEIELENGIYDVFLVRGSPKDTDVAQLDVEGTILDDPDGPDYYDEYELTVVLSDGRLTIQEGPDHFNHPKICFVHITLAISPEAWNPKPDNEVIDVPRDVVLSWEHGEFVAPINGHKVYFSESFNDVNDGIGAITQSADSYTPPQRLDFDTTYYWRVDEVNAPPDSTVCQGRVWSFTTELLAYPVENITATASSTGQEGMGPENTINGSGLDISDLHLMEAMDMWISSDEPNGAWIEYEFDKVHKLHEMWVWNSNQAMESILGLGCKDVSIEYSVNGTDYTTLAGVPEFAQASGAFDYAHNTTIDFSGVTAKYIRLTANSNWGGIFKQYGLSEVRFFSIPVFAREPSPDSGTTDVAVNVTLGFRAGREAAEHNVYISTDEQAVIDNTAFVAAVTDAGYGPLSLDYATTYYWRVDEVNDLEDPAAVEGDIWSFTTKEFLVIDDFELYDSNDNQIWHAWKDGLGYGTPDVPPYFTGNGTGAAVGDETTNSFTEETIVHEGGQAMPFAFDNNKQGYAKYSEAELTLSNQRDWTVGGVKELSLWFRGNPASVGSFTEAPAGTYTMTAAGADIFNEADEFHYAFKMLTGAGSIIARIDSVEQTDDWAKAGVMVRETLEPGSKFAAVYITPTNTDGTATNGCRFQARRDTDAGATSDSDVATAEQMAIIAPYWVKIERDVAGNFRASFSADGSTWRQMSWNPQSISMNSNVYVGLALTSHNNDETCEAKFSNVTITGTVGQQWANQDVGIASNDAEPMYVAVSNSAGIPAVVVNDDANASQTGTWTEWVIPLQAFADQGINLSNVDRIAIGLGTKGNTTIPGGSGKMFFDDIRLYRSSEAAE